MSHDTAAAAFPSPGENRAAMLWAIAVGLLQAATPLLIWWLDRATVYALGLAVIAGIYVGFAVADGRAKVIAVESGVAFAFHRRGRRRGDRITVACQWTAGRPRGKDLWQHRSHFVPNTRWWPPAPRRP
jgi:hypothetical protein